MRIYQVVYDRYKKAPALAGANFLMKPNNRRAMPYEIALLTPKPSRHRRDRLYKGGFHGTV